MDKQGSGDEECQLCHGMFNGKKIEAWYLTSTSGQERAFNLCQWCDLKFTYMLDTFFEISEFFGKQGE